MNKIDTLLSLTLNITDGKHGDCVDEENSGFYFISSKDVYDGKIHFDEARQITKTDYEDTNKRTKLEKNDILITNSGSIGRLCFLSPTDKTSNITFQKSVAVIKPNTEKVIPKYLYYNFSYNVALLIRRAVGSNQKNLLLSDLRELELNYHDNKIIQKKIADILTSLDDKISLNNRINTELEQMAKTLYNYWFVQFNIPDEEGKPYKTFGGEMEYNEELKRDIPKGWEAKNIEEIEKNIITGKTPSTTNNEFYNGVIPFITIADIRGNVFIVNTEKTLSQLGADSQPNKYLPKDSICVSCIASPGLVGFVNELAQTNQQINSIVCKNVIHKYYLYFSIKSFFDFSFGAKIGNTFVNMNKEEFATIKLIYPSINILEQYYNIVSPIFENIRTRILENKELTQLRDFLLPLLMNGQVKVMRDNTKGMRVGSGYDNTMKMYQTLRDENVLATEFWAKRIEEEIGGIGN